MKDIDAIAELAGELFAELDGLSFDDKVSAINAIRARLSEHSPFASEPIDCVEWVPVETVKANDYNPNRVAPPEMELLRHSINHDGYTQPVVTWSSGKRREVVDGFHRTRVCKECNDVNERVKGYLPVVTIQEDRIDRKDRIASTIRHNRARGKHNVEAMSEIVLELKSRNWRNERIARELGMDEDEVLRLCQITGLESLFKDVDFSRSWEIGSEDDKFEPLVDTEVDEECRTVNTSDPNRIFHTYDKWECEKAGFYATSFDGMNKEQCESAYAEFLADIDRFEGSLKHVISEWKNSCEHYLTNKAMNRIAWLGQAAMCYSTGVPSRFCSGYNLLSDEQKQAADEMALKYLNIWLKNNSMGKIEMDEALSIGRQVEIY